MPSNIPGNVPRHSGECCQTFRRMSSKIPENVLKHSAECLSYSKKWERGVIPTIHVVVFVFGLDQENYGAGELKIPLCNPGGERFSSGLLQFIISYLAELHLEFCQKPAMELFCKNSQRPWHVDYFCKKASSQMFDPNSKCTSDWNCCRCGVYVDCNCMKYVFAGWCTGK